jgi:hypothetical protein
LKSSFAFAVLALGLIVPNLAFAEEGTASVDVEGTVFDVTYDATGLIVDGIDADPSTGSLIVYVTTQDVESSLVITLERSFFDSQTDGEDEDFIVLADGFDTTFEETKTDTARILTITIPSGTNSLDIISLGTTSFGVSEEIPSVEEPEETPEEEIPEEQPEEPQTQCGPGTVLKDGTCVLEQQEVEEMPEEIPEEQPEEPQTQCGPGTVLKDGACVLDERCGPGTIYQDGQCVLEETSSESSAPGNITFQLVAPAVAAFVIAFIIMIILWAIGRASKKKS